ncbi:Uncharacterised protein [Bordetella pertussis]|nr:Uncharacterised protein [Bordetella pertussis]
MPGATQLMRIPSVAWSSAMARVSAATAPLEAQYAARWRKPTSAPADAVLTITPAPWRCMIGMTYLQPRNTPSTLTRISADQSASSVSTTVAAIP